MNIRTATSTVRVGGECVGQHLERHLPIELGVPCAIHLPHPAFAYEGGYVAVGDAGADG